MTGQRTHTKAPSQHTPMVLKTTRNYSMSYTGRCFSTFKYRFSPLGELVDRHPPRLQLRADFTQKGLNDLRVIHDNLQSVTDVVINDPRPCLHNARYQPNHETRSVKGHFRGRCLRYFECLANNRSARRDRLQTFPCTSSVLCLFACSLLDEQ